VVYTSLVKKTTLHLPSLSPSAALVYTVNNLYSKNQLYNKAFQREKLYFIIAVRGLAQTAML